MSDDENRDERRDWLRELFTATQRPPRDVVPHREPTPEEKREHLLQMNAATDTWREVTRPGEVVCDIDGVPIGIEAPEVETVYCGGAAVTLNDLDRAGLTSADVPKLTVIENPRKDHTHE